MRQQVETAWSCLFLLPLKVKSTVGSKCSAAGMGEKDGPALLYTALLHASSIAGAALQNWTSTVPNGTETRTFLTRRPDGRTLLFFVDKYLAYVTTVVSFPEEPWQPISFIV